MFEIRLEGVDALTSKFDRLTKQIEDAKTELPNMVIAWQRDDMHRKYPNQQTGGLGGGSETFVLTSIWPRSRTYDRAKRVSPKAQGPRRYTPGGVRLGRSTRPILRAELYVKLMQRLVELGRKAMKWP
jgi:hypothetical protein